MIKSIKTIMRQDREPYRIPRRVQDVIPIQCVWPDGIFKVGIKFSKTYRFTDINYKVASREDKETMFLAYSELLNGLDKYRQEYNQMPAQAPGEPSPRAKRTLNSLSLCPCGGTAWTSTARSITKCSLTRRPGPTASSRRNLSP